MLSLTKVLPITLKLVKGKKIPIGGLNAKNRIDYTLGLKNFAIYLADYPDIVVLDLDTETHRLDKYRDLTYTHRTRKGWHCFFKNTYNLTTKRQKQSEKYDLLAGNNWCFFNYNDPKVAQYVEYNTLPLMDMPEELYDEVKIRASDIGEQTLITVITQPLINQLKNKHTHLWDNNKQTWTITNSSDLAWAVTMLLLPYTDDKGTISKVFNSIPEIGDKHSQEQYLTRLVESAKQSITNTKCLTWRPLSDYRVCTISNKTRYIDINNDTIVGLDNVKFFTVPNTNIDLLGEFVKKYPNVRFLPNQTERFKGDTYNLFDGFVAPIEGTGHEQFLQYVMKALCKDNQQHYTYLLSYMAHMVQKPHHRPDVAIVLFGEQKGTGKDTFHQILSRIFRGNGYVAVTDEVINRFNSPLEYALLGKAEELVFGGSHKEDSKLKKLITGDNHDIELKGVEPYSAKNYIRLVVTSNHSRPVRATDGERRYFALKPSTYYKGNFDFWESLYSNFDPSSLMYFLLNYDISTFNPRQMPSSDYLQEIIDMNKDKLTERIEHWWSTIDNNEFFVPSILFEELVDHSDKYMTQRQFTGILFGICGKDNFKKSMTKQGQGYRVIRPVPTAEELEDVQKHNNGETIIELIKS